MTKRRLLPQRFPFRLTTKRRPLPGGGLPGTRPPPVQLRCRQLVGPVILPCSMSCYRSHHLKSSETSGNDSISATDEAQKICLPVQFPLHGVPKLPSAAQRSASTLCQSSKDSRAKINPAV